jgi:hypothetical protein
VHFASGARGGHPCAECVEVIDDLVLDTFTRLRRAIAGQIAYTKTGELVTELALVAAHVQSTEATDEDAATMAARLIRLNLSDPDAGQAWLRAAKAQLVHYPTRYLTATLRRDIARTRGGAARPDRDLTTAAWATPLRRSKAGLELLIAFVYRLRQGAPNPHPVPEDIQSRHELTDAQAYTLLRATLEQLRTVRPGFFNANIAAPLALGYQTSLGDADPAADAHREPEQHILALENAGHARAVLSRLVSRRPGEGDQWRRRRNAYRQILLAITAVADGDRIDLLGRCTQRLGLPELPTSRMLRKLARLVADAGTDWVTNTLTVPRHRLRRDVRHP